MLMFRSGAHDENADDDDDADDYDDDPCTAYTESGTIVTCVCVHKYMRSQ